MFTIGEGENHDPKSPGNSGVTTESIFSGPTPSNFWIVTSFVIPNDLKNKDWWVVAFIDEHGNVVEGFKEIFDISLYYGTGFFLGKTIYGENTFFTGFLKNSFSLV